MIDYKVICYNEVEYGAVEDLINEVYELDPRNGFCVAADLETNNDTDHTFLLEKEPLDDYATNNLEQFIATKGEKPGYMTGTLLQDLVNKGLVPEGKLLINISW